MKSKTLIVLAILMVMIVAFSGCAFFGDNNNNNDNNDNNSDGTGDNNSGSAQQYNVVVNKSANSNIYSPLADVVEDVQDSVVVINCTLSNGTSSGSGVLYGYTDNGSYNFILTCHHVIEGAATIKVKYTSGETVDATVVGGHYESDIAVLKVPKTAGKEYKYASIRDYDDGPALRVGEGVLVIGNPLGVLGGTVTSGIVSGMKRTVNVENIEMTLLQTDAAINQGNSGGAMFDYNGQLIGIVNAKTAGTGIEGLGYAIPIEDALEISTFLIETSSDSSFGYVPGYYFIGIAVSNTTLNGTECVIVNSIHSDGSFYGSTLRNNDYILAVTFGEQSTNITSATVFKNYFKERQIGDVFTVTYQRSRFSQPQYVEITLEQYIYEY